jgi:hypothetical protein
MRIASFNILSLVLRALLLCESLVSFELLHPVRENLREDAFFIGEEEQELSLVDS